MKYILIAMFSGFIGYAGASYDNYRSKQLAAEKWDKTYFACMKQGNLMQDCILKARSEE
ncbi:hypothetical protein G3A1_059 [Escherichia phage vB_EcoP-G3A1]|uniref:Uncharacterized protein n=1 Tax=Escherichia phage vB_EcoP-101117UKE2 TaxID=2865796 RepID=A0AAE7XRW8_9CAUD|nr:hypothetical protein 101117UKE2_059 [Escherichia phage vB_EcoP-101117UKE2]QZI79685.1 hypothetical protein 101118B1_060 [Escherichia phage vB_EcoP-101118B1]QZI81288.1 hypothetical protein G3A1_059 [Escherichia phage vB_EcoP-G3A1]